MKARPTVITLLLTAGITATAAALPQTAEVFANGTNWYQSFFPAPTGAPKPDDTYIEFSLDGEAEMLGQKCLKLWSRKAEDTAERTFVTYVRTEDDKVLFLHDEDASDWELMYDFGLQPGESCTVTSPAAQWSHVSPKYQYSIKCTSIRPSVDYPGMEEMDFVFDRGYESSKKSTPDATWIKGIGSTGGLLTTVFLDGAAGGTLLKVWNAADLICEYTTLSVQTSASDDATYTIHDRDITLTKVNGLRISVYGIDGKPIHQSYAAGDRHTVSLPDAGIYIVKAGSMSAKVAIR